MSALAWRDELASARAVAAERRRVWDEAPDLTADEIVDGFQKQRELRSLSIEVPVGGTTRPVSLHYFHPISATDYFEAQSTMEGETDPVMRMAKAIVARARNADGSPKFKPEHAASISQWPLAVVVRLANTFVPTHAFSVVAAEKK